MMKRSISITSISSSDSVIPLDIIDITTSSSTRHNQSLQTTPKQNGIQTRSKVLNSNSKHSSLNTTNNSPSQQSTIYIDSEQTSSSDHCVSSSVNNKDDDLTSFTSMDNLYSDKMSIVSSESAQITDFNKPYSRRTRLKYSFSAYAKEDHGSEIYNVQIYNSKEENPSRLIFATVGSNRCSIYEYSPYETNKIKLIETFMDADSKELFYTCCWTNDYETNLPLLLIGGIKGIVRSILLFTDNKRNEKIMKHALFGHGSAINDLRIHPIRKTILLSSSKDNTMRLWNLKSNVCIAIFGGCEGHRDEVLSSDFHLSGSYIMSCGIDHSLKMWNLNNLKIKTAIEESEIFDENMEKPKKKFNTITHHFPDYTTCDVHSNYIDCVRWFGDFVFSKSCENCIVCWKPGLLTDNLNKITRSNKNVSVLYTFTVKECDIWFVRFAMDSSQRTLALGTQYGKLYVWNLDVDDPNEIRHTLLSHPKSKRSIRATALSLNGKYLIATSDDSHIWIWNLDNN